MRDVVVAGAGLHRYGIFPDKTSIDLGTVAIQRALDDAGCRWTDIEAVFSATTIWRHPGTGGFARVLRLSFPRSKRYRQVQGSEAYPGLATRSGLLHRPGAAGELACSVARAA